MRFFSGSFFLYINNIEIPYLLRGVRGDEEGLEVRAKAASWFVKKYFALLGLNRASRPTGLQSVSQELAPLRVRA